LRRRRALDLVDAFAGLKTVCERLPPVMASTHSSGRATRATRGPSASGWFCGAPG